MSLMAPDVVVQVKECDVCRMAIRIIAGEGREVAYDVSTGLEHDCFVLPEDAHVLVLEDEDCDCGH
jgi:hypothetical protein